MSTITRIGDNNGEPADPETRPHRRKRLSADLPQNWLDSRGFLRMSDDAKLLYFCGLMWAIGRTNGKIPDYALNRLCPYDLERRALPVKELCDFGRWKPYTTDGGGWRYVDWADHQSTVEQIDANRRRERVKKRRQRANVPQGRPKGIPQGSTERNGKSTALIASRNFSRAPRRRQDKANVLVRRDGRP